MFNDELPDNEASRLQKAHAPLRSFDERMTRPGFRRTLILTIFAIVAILIIVAVLNWVTV